MTAAECRREAEVAEALTSGRWPEACPADLRDHVTACPACAEVVAVMEPLQRERAQAMREAPVPAAHVVWWRAQIRARAEAERAVAQPVTFAQAVAAVSVVALLLALMPTLVAWLGDQLLERDVFQSTVSSLSTVIAAFGSVEAGALTASAAVGAATACVVLVSAALYFVLVDE